MKPSNLKTRIFADTGDPDETKELISRLGFLDGQTTNPSLVAKNPQVKARLDKDEKFSEVEILEFYKKIVQDLSRLMPDGSISIEVYADKNTPADQMFAQGKEFFSWIPNAHIKYPTTSEGLKAAERSVKGGMRVNMTLCFTQAQAAAVYAATKGAKKGEVFVSPFVGRLDDRGENGMDLIKNIIEMYKSGDGHVEVLTASVRNLNHFMYALAFGSDIITAPTKVILEWASGGLQQPEAGFKYEVGSLKPIEFQALDLSKPWQEFDLSHPLTDQGVEKFAADWNALIE